LGSRAAVGIVRPPPAGSSSESHSADSLRYDRESSADAMRRTRRAKPAWSSSASRPFRSFIRRGPGKAWNCSIAPSCASVCEHVSRGSPLRALPPREHHFCALSLRSRQRSRRADEAAKK
jgi:hypothetical protein